MPPEDNNEKNMSAENQPNWNDENVWNNIPEYHEENSSNQTPEPKNEAQMGDAGQNEPKFADNNLQQIENSTSTKWVDSQPILYPTDPIPPVEDSNGGEKEKKRRHESKSWSTSLNSELEAIKNNSMTTLIAKFDNLANIPKSFASESSNPMGILNAALELRLAQLEEKAATSGLLGDVYKKETEILSPEFNKLEDDLKKGRLKSNDPRINGFRTSTINGQRLDNRGIEEEEELKGIRQFLLDRMKEEYREKVDTLQKKLAADEEARGITLNVKEYLEEAAYLDVSISENLEIQRRKVRNILTRVEGANGSITGSDVSEPYRALLEYVQLDPNQKDKGKFHPDVESEIRASFHLCETVYRVRDNFDFESDGVRSRMKTTVEGLRSSNLLLNVADLDKLFIEGYNGLFINEAFDLLQDAALKGIDVDVDGTKTHITYQTKLDPKMRQTFIPILVEKLVREKGVSEEVAQRSFNLMLKATRAKFEDMPWDTALTHPVSEAVNYDLYLKKKNKLFVEDQKKKGGITVVTLGSSFDRMISKMEPPYESLFLRDLDEKMRNGSQDEAIAAWWLISKPLLDGSRISMSRLSYDGVSYLDGVSSEAYADYLLNFIPAMLEAKKSFTDASLATLKRGDLEGVPGKKLLDSAQKVDPFGKQNLKAILMNWAIVRGHSRPELDFDAPQTSLLLYNMMKNGIIDEPTKVWLEKNSNVLIGGIGVGAVQKLEGLKQFIK